MPKRAAGVTLQTFGRVGIYLKQLRDDGPAAVVQLLEFLEGRGASICLDEEAARQSGRKELFRPGDQIPAQVDLVIVLGGDGTMLRVVRQLGGRQVPVVGINFGSLGFLTEISRERMIPVLEEIFDGRYRLERRMMLEVTVSRGGTGRESFRALNDAVFNYGTLARIIHLEVEVDSQFLTCYNADGLIVSSPTGSTAYSLSAGGPILSPTQRSLILSPICPHTLTHRPIVLEDTSTVTVRLIGRGDVMLTVDGQTGTSLTPEDEVRIRRAGADAHFLVPADQSFFQVLRQKLKWGER